jgi:hypothetical protein
MPDRQRYRRKPGHAVVAVQLRLETEGLHYRKWGHEQFARAGDWLVDDDGDVHTVAAESFARTYREVGRGTYVKTAPVWAERAREAGSLATLEGRTAYAAGDWLVSNREDGSDAYAVGAEAFSARYEPDV